MKKLNKKEWVEDSLKKAKMRNLIYIASLFENYSKNPEDGFMKDQINHLYAEYLDFGETINGSSQDEKGVLSL